MSVTLPILPPDFPHAGATGVFRCTPTQALVAAEAAARLGCDVRHINLQGSRGKAETLTRIAISLDFPVWFGHNWDALADCLSDLSWLPENSCRVFIFEGCNGHEEALPVLIEILAQTCDDWAERALRISCVFALEEESR